MIIKFKKGNFLLFIIILIFFVNQVNNLKIGGTTIDERSLDNGNLITFNKIQDLKNFNIFNGSRLNPNLNQVSKMETYGQFVSFQQFLFSRLFYQSEFISNYFENNNLFQSFYSKTTFLRYIYLNLYVSFMLILLYFAVLKFKNQLFAVTFISLLILIPSFSGHSLFNQKDISFLIHVFLACYFIVQYNYENNNQTLIIKAFLSGLAISLRISGIAFIYIAIIFSAFRQLKSKKSSFTQIYNYYLKFTFLALFFYFFFSPGSWFSPIDFIIESFRQQIFLSWDGYTLTNGKFISSSEMSPLYLIIWYLHKLPVVYIIYLIAAYLGLFLKELKNDTFYVFSLFFIFSINLVFIIIRPEVYDGIRQFLFLLPFIVYVSTSILLQIQKSFIYIIPITFIYLFITQQGLGPYKYVYFNELVDEENITFECKNIDGCGNWLTDYWGFSAKEMASYINENKLENIYLCKTVEIWDPYIDEALKPIFYDLDKITKKEFLVATIYRPRFEKDGCGFLQNGINYNCELIHVTNVRLRGKTLDLNYLKKCVLSN